MKIEKAKSKSDSLVKLALVFFISLLSFSIGTYVGKKYSDNQHKIAALEPSSGGSHGALAERSVASVHGDDSKATESEKSESLTDEEIKKLAEEFVADDSAEAGPSAATGHNVAAGHSAAPAHTAAPAQGEVAPKAETHSATSDSTTKAALNVIEEKPVNNENAKARKPTAIPETLPKDVAQYSVGKYTVQIASYPTEGEAKKKADELKQKGYSAFFIPAHIQGKSWYRVSVGLFSTEKEAKEYRDEFKDKTKVSTAIIQKIID